MTDIIQELEKIAAVPPGEQSLWTSTIAAWAVETIHELEERISLLEEQLQGQQPHIVKPCTYCLGTMRVYPHKNLPPQCHDCHVQKPGGLRHASNVGQSPGE